MPTNPDWTPMRWPGAWTDSSLLTLLKGTPIDCLVVDCDSPECERLTPVLDQARRLGLAVAGLTEAGTGNTAGLAALASPQSLKGAGLPVIPWIPRDGLPAAPASPILAFTGNVWPSVRLRSREDRDTESAGPTGGPWIDSNGWFVRMARTLAPSSAVWIVAEPPKEKSLRRPELYALAVTDPAVCGGRWVVSLDEELAAGIAAGNAEARSCWKKITDAMAFHRRRPEWKDLRPVGVLGLLSDFSGDNEFLSMEAVNLIYRHSLGFRILDRRHPQRLSFDGLKAIVYADQQAPEKQLSDQLLAFVKGGGLLIAGPSCSSFAAGATAAEESHSRFGLWNLGAGRVAVAREEIFDPAVLTVDAHNLLSHRNDLVQVWNAGSMIMLYCGSADERKAVVHIINFSAWPVEFMSLRVRKQFRTARLWVPGRSMAIPLRPVPDAKSTEFHLPPLASCAAIEMEA
ncbi:MAG: hypothetical protein ABFD89_06275 [Bryobacteraceae bacterium]